MRPVGTPIQAATHTPPMPLTLEARVAALEAEVKRLAALLE
jgi:hypothetical protein